MPPTLDKWNSVYVLKLMTDMTITSSASDYKKYHGLEVGHYFELPFSVFTTTKYDPRTDQALGKIKLQDKLMIVSHGSTMMIAKMTPDALAKFLHEECGLTEVGLITFKACDIGRGVFLEDFKRACDANDIMVGWLKGYRGYAVTVFPEGGKPTEKIKHHKKKEDDKQYKEGTKRYKIIKGNHPFTVTDKRYFIDAQDD